jgi:hypothetical protein
MATFQAQVEGLTGVSVGTTPTTAELTQFLIDGVLDVTNRLVSINANSSVVKSFTRSTSESTSQGGITNNTAKIISVVREAGVNNDWRDCRIIPINLQSRVTDVTSLHYTSKYNPSYAIGGDGAVMVFPAPESGGADSYKVYYINNAPVNSSDASLAFSHSDINYFPEDKVYLVVIYAGIKTLEAKLSEYIVDEEDLEIAQGLALRLASIQTQYDDAFKIDSPAKTTGAPPQQAQAQRGRR